LAAILAVYADLGSIGWLYCEFVNQYSLRQTAATVGQQLLDLRYVKTKCESRRWMSHTQRYVYALLTIGAVWIDNRLDDFVALTRHISATDHVCILNFTTDSTKLHDFILYFCMFSDLQLVCFFNVKYF